MNAEMVAYDEARDTLIKKARDIIKFSKGAIYSLHRGEMSVARKQLTDAEAAARALLPSVLANPTLRAGGFSAGLEEFVEARAFEQYLLTGRLIRLADLEIVDRNE